MNIPARANHAEAMAHIHHACFSSPAGWGAPELRCLMESPGVSGWICEAGGFILVQRAADIADILTLAVTPGVRRGGVGRRLLNDLMSNLQAAVVREVFLEVARENQAAISLYKQAGFQIAGVRHNYYGSGTDALLLSVSLKGCAIA